LTARSAVQLGNHASYEETAPMTTMMVQVAHQVPGRIRLKVPKLKENPELIERIEQMFNMIPGIEEVAVNPVTGSVVLHYDTDCHDEFHDSLQHYTGRPCSQPVGEIDVLANKIEQEAEYLSAHSHTAQVVIDYFKGLDREIKIATGNAIDLQIVLAAGIAAFTVFEVGATAATPIWVTLAIFAINHMIHNVDKAHHTEKGEAFAPG